MMPATRGSLIQTGNGIDRAYLSLQMARVQGGVRRVESGKPNTWSNSQLNAKV